MKRIKEDKANLFLLGLLLFILLIAGIIAADVRRPFWKKAEWYIQGESDEVYAYIYKVESFAKDEKESLRTPATRTHTFDNSSYLRFIHPDRRSNRYIINYGSYIYPSRLTIEWASITENEAWQTTIELPDKYYKGMGDVYEVHFSLKKEGNVKVYVKNERKVKQLGTYTSEKGEWKDVLKNISVHKPERETQIEILSPVPEWTFDVKAIEPGMEPGEGTIRFYGAEYDRNFIREYKELATDHSDTVLFNLDFIPEKIELRNANYFYRIQPDPVELLNALKEIHEKEPASLPSLSIYILARDSFQLNLVSESGLLTYPVTPK